MIDVTLLGTAALMPIPERALTAALLTCSGRGILFDCGEGTQTAARKAGVSLMKTDLIALTHYHGDHIFGLPGLLQTMNCMGRTEPLFITGPGDIDEALQPIMQLTGSTAFPIKTLQMDDTGICLADLSAAWPVKAQLCAFPTFHRTVSQGYCFTLDRAGRFCPDKARALGVPVSAWKALQNGESVHSGGRMIEPEEVLGEARRGIKFAFTGDTAAHPSVSEACAQADLMICEATYAEDAQLPLAEERGHTVFSRAAAMAAAAGARRLWLAHYSQQIENPEDFLKNAAEIFPNTECGYDGKHIRLEFEA